MNNQRKILKTRALGETVAITNPTLTPVCSDRKKINPNIYGAAGNLYNRYKEYFNID